MQLKADVKLRIKQRLLRDKGKKDYSDNCTGRVLCFFQFALTGEEAYGGVGKGGE